MLHTIVVKTPNFLITEFSYKMNQIAWGMIGAAFCVVILISIWNVLRKPLSKCMKIKEVKVEILYVHIRYDKYKAEKDSTVAVRMLQPKKRRRKVFLMNCLGIKEGDVGVLKYQGIFGLEFKREDSVLVDKMDRYHHFGFQKDKEVETERKERKKRKYW